MKLHSMLFIFGLMAPYFSVAQTAPAVDPVVAAPTSYNGVTGSFLKLETISSTRDLDAENMNAITTRLKNDASMAPLIKDISITSRDSVIYVDGKVLTNSERLRVLDHARSLSAANRVVDRLAIVEPVVATPTPAPAPPAAPMPQVLAPASEAPITVVQ